MNIYIFHSYCISSLQFLLWTVLFPSVTFSADISSSLSLSRLLLHDVISDTHSCICFLFIILLYLSPFILLAKAVAIYNNSLPYPVRIRRSINFSQHPLPSPTTSLHLISLSSEKEKEPSHSKQFVRGGYCAYTYHLISRAPSPLLTHFRFYYFLIIFFFSFYVHARATHIRRRTRGFLMCMSTFISIFLQRIRGK